MKDIARELGVSVATVSRALKDSPRISAEQRERIKSFAREHNFYPNAIAESLRRSKTRPSTLIGVIIPQINHFYFSSILAGIEEQANVRGYSVVVAQSGEKYEREVRICESFQHNRVCGVIVSQAKDTKQYGHFQQLFDKNIPLVFYDRICTGMNTNRVVVDDYMGAFTAVSHLIDTGCRRIAFYGSPMTMEISKNRYNGYRDAILKHGLAIDDSLRYTCDCRVDAEALTPEVMAREDRPDSFLPSTTIRLSAFFTPSSAWASRCRKISASAVSQTVSEPLPANRCSPPLNSVATWWARRPWTSL